MSEGRIRSGEPTGEGAKARHLVLLTGGRTGLIADSPTAKTVRPMELRGPTSFDCLRLVAVLDGRAVDWAEAVEAVWSGADPDAYDVRVMPTGPRAHPELEETIAAD